jgi:hypothetical protein
MGTDELLTTGDAAQALGCREWQVSRLFERGLLPEPRRVGGKRVLTRADLDGIRVALIRAGYLRSRTETGATVGITEAGNGV